MSDEGVVSGGKRVLAQTAVAMMRWLLHVTLSHLPRPVTILIPAKAFDS
jgi:hypothetical protein